MKVLIIEDELPAAKRLASLLKICDEAIEIVGFIDSNEALLTWYQAHAAPDLIFSDIELLDGQVFDGLKQVDWSTPIIFTTAYAQYALEAFDTTGISYLLKPFDEASVQKALGKFQSLKQTAGITDETVQALRQFFSQSESSYKTKLSVKVGNGIYLLTISEINCITTQNGLVYAHRLSGKKLPLSHLVSDLEELLDPRSFHRINRGDIVNAQFIEKVEPYFNDRMAVMIKGQKEKLIASGGRTPGFRKWLKEI